MKEYFALKFKMSCRKLKEMGINPFLGYLLGLVGFVMISEYIFIKTEFAKYLVILIAIILLLNLSQKNRMEFLRIVFKDNKYRHIRIAENFLLALPFSILLLYHRASLEAILLLLISPVLVYTSFRTNFNFTIPTPFYKRPFEFAVGFRNTFYIYPVAYIFAYIAIAVDNFNLGIFALFLLFLVSMTYYVKPENEYYIWSNSSRPSKFLFDKIKTAAFYSTCIVLPVMISLIVFYPDRAEIIILSLILGLAFLSTVILAKYSAYPNEINIPEGILIAVCIYFPPLLLALIPFFYGKSVKKLNPLLK